MYNPRHAFKELSWFFKIEVTIQRNFTQFNIYAQNLEAHL